MVERLKHSQATQADLNKRMPARVFQKAYAKALLEIEQEDNPELEQLMEEIKGSRRFTAKDFTTRVNT